MDLPCKYVVLKDGDVVIDSEVYGGLEGHGFQGGVDGVTLMEGLAKQSPRHYSPVYESV